MGRLIGIFTGAIIGPFLLPLIAYGLRDRLYHGLRPYLWGILLGALVSAFSGLEGVGYGALLGGLPWALAPRWLERRWEDETNGPLELERSDIADLRSHNANKNMGIPRHLPSPHSQTLAKGRIPETEKWPGST